MSAPLAPERLADFEAICRLKYRLFRGMDVHNVELIEECFTGDAVVDFGDGAYSASGRTEIGSMFRRILTPGFTSSHLALHPEIEFANPAAATGRWRFESTSLTFDEPTNCYGEQHNAGYYTDDYVKDGVWRVARSAYSLNFSIRQPSEHEQPRTVTVFGTGGHG